MARSHRHYHKSQIRSMVDFATIRETPDAKFRHNAHIIKAAREAMVLDSLNETGTHEPLANDMNFGELLGILWCRVIHDIREIEYGGGSYYTCCTCKRRYVVPWTHKIRYGVYAPDTRGFGPVLWETLMG